MSTTTDGLDELLNEIQMGRWQVLGLVANFLIWAVLAPHTIGTTLLNAPVPFLCISDDHVASGTLKFPNASVEYEFSHASFQDGVLNASIFDNECIEEGQQLSLSRGSDASALTIHLENSSFVRDPLAKPLLPSCPYVRYDESIFSSTVTTEWHLVCEKSTLRSLFQDSYTIGLIVGGFVGGDIGDRLGRARAVLLGSFIHAVATIIVAFTTNFSLLLIGRFTVGLTNLMILVTVVTLSIETCPEKFRGPIGMLVGMPYSLGVVVFAALGVFLRDWRHLYIATSFPALLLIPVAWLLDESPRWLLQVGRLDEAREIIEKAAKINRHKFDSMDRVNTVLQDVLKKEELANVKSEKADYSLLDRVKKTISGALGAIRTPAMRKISIISPTVWFLNETVYYGTIFNANSFSSGNPFLYVAMTGVCDALGIILGTIGTYFSRKMTVGGSQYISGSLLLLVLAVPEELKWLQWIFVMTGFLMCACASQALFVYTPELFPTTIRARGFAFSNLTGYTGTLVAPFIPDLLARYGWWITNTILGSIGLIAGTMIMTLIETNHLPLCETVQDVEEREKRMTKTLTFINRPNKNRPTKNNAEKDGQKQKIGLEDDSGSSIRETGIDNPTLEKD